MFKTIIFSAKQLNRCKKILLIVLTTMWMPFGSLKAQNPAMNSLNNQLRSMFSSLSRPTPSWWFLYEMSAHSTDSAWFTRFCPNTNETDAWYKVYEEMYHSAYDTAQLTTVQQIMEAAQNYTNDIIPVGIMHYSYYTLRPEAMQTGDYFDFDLDHDILTDKYPRPGWPYMYEVDHTIFMSAPLLATTHSANPTYLISPDFIYTDDFNADHFSAGKILKINFDDGAGWIDFDPAQTTYHPVIYHDAQPTLHIIKVQLGDRGNIFGTSQSNIWVNNTINATPDGTIDAPGLNVSVFNNCNGSAAKTVIYLEGIDPLDFKPSWNKTANDIYSSLIQSDQIVELKNQGYRFVVVDWKNSRIDMRFNALYLVNLIQILKAANPNNEQFVIMGESMGGVIARYALTYMESKEFTDKDNRPFFTEAPDPQNAEYIITHPFIRDLPVNWAQPERMHNTRLFISIDAPHQGANIPISIQKMYKYVIGQMGPFIGTGLSSITSVFNLFLESKAVKQLLICHIETEFGIANLTQYRNHPNRTSFMAQLANLGNYPQFAKIMLMSNGSLQGANQLNYYTNVPRVANDKLLDFKLSTYARIFGIKIPLFGGALELRTNPDGSGQVLQANAGMYSVRIRLRWFGIRIVTGYNSILDRVDYACTRPYCTSAGGFFGNPLGVVTNTAQSTPDSWLFNLITTTTTNDGNGCLSFDSHLGWNGFLTGHLDYRLCSDGFHFALVPVQSALDYAPGRGLPLDFNIEVTHDIITKLDNIPTQADVAVGIPGDNNTITDPRNWGHVGFRNDDIRNLTNVVSPLPNFENTYFSCLDHDPQVRRGFLNLEIGDEELYLENNVLTYNAAYKVEYDIHVNERNPHYEYLSQPFTPERLLGVYSKQNDYIIATPNGFGNFVYDATNTPGVGFAGTVVGSFSLTDEVLDNCCINYIARGKGPSANRPRQDKITESFLKLFPNPNQGKLLTLQYQFKKAGKTELSIVNMQGQRVANKTFYIPNNEKIVNTTIDLKTFHVAPGFYVIRLTNAGQTLTGKLIITK